MLQHIVFMKYLSSNEKYTIVTYIYEINLVMEYTYYIAIKCFSEVSIYNEKYTTMKCITEVSIYNEKYTAIKCISEINLVMENTRQ